MKDTYHHTAFVENELVLVVFTGHNIYVSGTWYRNLPSDYTQRLMKIIVAFKSEVKEMDTEFKLSQDRDVDSYRNIIFKLKTH